MAVMLGIDSRCHRRSRTAEADVEVTEVSAHVYGVSARDHWGRSVEAKGTDTNALVDDAKRTAMRMINDAPFRFSGPRHFESARDGERTRISRRLVNQQSRKRPVKPQRHATISNDVLRHDV